MLQGGKTLTFSVAPKTDLTPGTYQENIIIQGKAPDGGTAAGTLTVKVQVAAANRNVTFSTSGLNFGYWQEGQTPQERGVEIRNNGNISLSLKVELDEAVEKGFTYELRAGTDATPPVLPAPQNYQDKRSLWLYLVPKAGLPAGDYSGNVTVKDAYSGAVLGTVSVSYFAQQAQIEVTGKDGTLLATASAGNNGAATLDFGEMPYGYTPAQYSQAVTVKNTGNVAVEVGYTGGSDWLASSDSLSSTLQPGATRTMTFTVPAGKGLGQQTREPGTASGGNIWVRMQNDVQAFARVYLGYTFTVTKPATWGEWLYDAQAQTLTRLSDNLTLQNVTAGGTSLTIGEQYSFQSTELDLTGAITDADGTAYTITALAQRAFIGYKLAAVTLPDGLQSIGDNAFSRCSALTAIDIPASVTSIGAGAFYDCTSLTAVTLPAGLQSIGDNAFRGCSALTSIDIPASVTSIGVNAFNGCTRLKDVTLPDGLQSIGDNAFRVCSELTSIDIPASVTSIGEDAFYGCTRLTAVTLHDGLESIGDYAFYGCTSLTAIDIPASVTSIGAGAFDGCSSLAAVTLPEGLQSIGDYAFDGCTSLTAIRIPGTVKTVGMYSFQDCSALASLELAEGVKELGTLAFRNCSALTQVTLPASLTKVGIDVFAGHGPSIVFTSLATTPPSHNGGFPLGEVAGVTLYVPQGSLVAYRSAFGWKNYLDNTFAIQATLSPAAHTFAAQAQGYGDVAPATFTVTNRTGGAINLGAPTLSGANAAGFEIDAAGLPQTLALGESATFTVRPKTGLAAGSYTAQVQLVAEDGAGTSQTLAAAVSFTVTPPVWRVGVAASPAGAGVCLVNGAEVSEASVEEGISLTLTAKENAGYRFLYWADGQGQKLTENKEYTVSPTANMQLQMVFEKLVYAITATPGTLEFEPRVAGYAAAPDARTVTVENTGNTEVTLALPTAQGYDIQAGSGFANGQATLAAGCTATFTVQPKTGLAAGNYARAINVAGTNGASAVVNAAFTVEPALALTAPATLAGGGKLTLTANKGADSVVCTTDAAYNPTAAAGGTTWTVTLPQTPGTYTFEATRTTAYGGTETATCTVTVTEKAAETGGQESQNTGRKPNPQTGVKAAH